MIMIGVEVEPRSRGRDKFTTSPTSSPNPLASVPHSRTLERHGLFTVERGRAGSNVQDFGEEAGSVSRVDSHHLRCGDGQTQMQDFLKMYSNLVERCFNACCNDFTSKALSSKEVRHDNFRHRLGLTLAIGTMPVTLRRQVPEAF